MQDITTRTSQADESVSARCHAGSMVRQSARPWEKIGISRATWYRHGKPTEKPHKPKTVPEIAKQVGATSTRTYYRMMRALQSELGRYVIAGHLSVAQADRILSDPENCAASSRCWLHIRSRRDEDETGHRSRNGADTGATRPDAANGDPLRWWRRAEANAHAQAQADTGRRRKQAAKAGIEVARYDVRPDGTISVVTGKPVGDIDMDDTASPDPKWN